MIVLDTNVVSELMKPIGNPIVEQWVDGQIAETLFVSATSLAELLAGIEVMPKGRRRQSLTLLLDEIVGILGGRVLPFDEAAARAYATLIAKARRQGVTIGMPDGQIASIALVHGFTVATRDTSPFLAAGVAFVNPWEAH